MVTFKILLFMAVPLVVAHVVFPLSSSDAQVLIPMPKKLNVTIIYKTESGVADVLRQATDSAEDPLFYVPDYEVYVKDNRKYLEV